jgi:hypothetical protein
MVERAAAIVRGRPGDDTVDDFLARLDELEAGDYIRFSARTQPWRSGLGPGEIGGLRSRSRRGAGHRMWTVMALVSADGFDRERAIVETELRRASVALLLVRSTDWVPEVRAAALSRIAGVPSPLLIDLLPLAEQLIGARERAGELGAVLDSRLSDDDLRAATLADDVRTRRYGWRRLVERRAYDAEDLRERAVRDPDVVVRATAAGVLPELPAEDRRAIASQLLADRVGWLAGRGLDALIDLDGEAAIRPALTAASVTLRRRARDWASTRGVDARAVYLALLDRDPADRVALTALAEIGDARDEDLLLDALRDERGPVRAAAIRALARVNPPAAKEAALEALVAGRSGRAGRAAVAALRRAALGDGDLRRIESVALDPARPDGHRVRALALLRSSRWRHLSALLQAVATASPPLHDRLHRELGVWMYHHRHASRPPTEPHRAIITSLLGHLDPAHRRSLEFILRGP